MSTRHTRGFAAITWQRGIARVCALLLLLASSAPGVALAQHKRGMGTRKSKAAATATQAPASSAPAEAPAVDASQGPAASPDSNDNSPAMPSGATPAPANSASSSASSAAPSAASASTPTDARAAEAPANDAKAAAASEASAREARADLSAVMDELVAARARAALLGKSLFKTRVSVRLALDAEEQIVGKVVLTLDGAPVFRGDGAAVREEAPLFSGYAAPGPHVLGVELEQRARADEAYRARLVHEFRFVVLRETNTELQLSVEDDSDIAEDFADDLAGEYDLRVRLQVEAVLVEAK